MVFIRNNKIAFFANQVAILSGGLIVLVMTYLFVQKAVDPALWMIVMGFGMYLPYIGFHTLLFERWIALFRYQSNIGYLMYISDAFGYLGSMGVLFYKNFGAHEISWLNFFITTAIVMGSVTVVLSGLAIGYFWRKERCVTSLA